MKKRNVLAILLAIIVIFAFVILETNQTISNILSPSKTFYCSKDTDCVFVCGSCENVTYFDSNPPSQCSTTTQTGARSCFCVNSQCNNAVNATNATSQPSFIQPSGFESFDIHYIFIGIIVVVAFIVLAVFINYLMKSPTETWVL